MVNINQILDTLSRELNDLNGTNISQGLPPIYQLTSVQDAGKNVMINCPYHGGGKERSPSFGLLKNDKVSKGSIIAMGHGNCFACGASKPFHAVISDMFGMNDGGEFGKHWLKERFGVDSIRQVSFVSNYELDPSPAPLRYEHYVQDHPYFRTRGISPEIAAMFQLGYDDYYKSIVIPVFDRNGKCRMMIKRHISEKRFYNTAGADKLGLLFGLDQVFQNLGRLKNATQIWVTESAIDAMLLWQQGFPAIALMQALPSEEQLAIIRKLPFEEVVSALDNDEAGENGSTKMISALQHSKTIYRVSFPEGVKDIGDMTPEQLGGLQIYEKTRPKNRQGNTPIENLSLDQKLGHLFQV